MTKITKPAQREIIPDFAALISQKKETGEKPATAVINFRNDQKIKKERAIYLVPTEHLRYRKDNGRISSDVISFEKHTGKLDETTVETQEKLRQLLEEKDKEKSEELAASIEHDGQREPAIITCDGFLINGNRRKMVLERLQKKNQDDKYKFMKVVILPGKDDGDGGPPTLLEIEEIENRYQLQSDGKAEYYSFDKALSMKRKIDMGMTLESQMKDDPQYASLPDKDLEPRVRPQLSKRNLL